MRGGGRREVSMLLAGSEEKNYGEKNKACLHCRPRVGARLQCLIDFRGRTSLYCPFHFFSIHRYVSGFHY